MDPEKYQRARAIFDDAAEVDDAALREALLSARCDGDAELKALVERLLAWETRTSMLDASPTEGVGKMAAQLFGPAVPEHLGALTIVGVLGEGGMGVVYEAIQPRPHRRVAVKVVHPWLQSDAASALFQREVEAMARLLHPGIPQVYEVFEVDDSTCLVMELVRGQPLLEAAAALGPGERLTLLFQLCEAAAHAHQHGITHRDIKPSNVLVTASGQPKLLDFGIADLGAGEGSEAGTAAYMPPEQRRGAAANPRADVYALGVVGIEMLTGQRPPEARLEGLARALRAVLEVATRPSPEDRYPNAKALADDLLRARSGLPVTALGSGALERVRSLLRRRRGSLAAAAVALALLAVVPRGLGALDQVQRERQAAAQLALLQADHASNPGALESKLEAFSSEPAHEGTQALARAWLWWGSLSSEADARRVYSRAWTLAPDEATSAEALEALTEALRRERDWAALARLQPRLRDGPLKVRVAGELALWRRDYAAAAAALPEAAALLTILSQTRPMLPDEPLSTVESLVSRQPATDEEPERIWLLSEEALLEVVGGEIRARLPPSPTEHTQGRLATGDGVHLLASSFPPRRHALWRFSDGAWTRQLEGAGWGSALALGDMDGDGQLERYYGTNSPARSLKLTAPDGDEVRSAHPATEQMQAAPVTIAPLDLDNDGDDELVVGLWDWRTTELRVLDGPPGAPRLAGRLRLENNRSIELLRHASGERLLAVSRAHDPYPAANRPAPVDGPRNGVALLRWTGDALAVERQIPLALPPHKLAVADLDGDHLDDLVIWEARSLRQDAPATLKPTAQILHQQPDGSFDSVLLSGLRPITPLQADDDEAAELWVVVGELSVLLGAGDQELPMRELTPGAAPPPPPDSISASFERAWARSWTLADAGLMSDASLALEPLSATAGPAGHSALRGAAELAARSGDGERAAALYQRLLREAASEGHPVPPETAAAAAEVFADRFALDDLRSALALAPATPALDEWRQRLEAMPTTVIDFEAPLDPAWHIAAPESLRRDTEGRLQITTAVDDGLLAELPLVGGPLLTITLDLEVLQLDWSAGLHFALRQGETVLPGGMGIQHSGGKGHHATSLNCGHRGGQLELAPYTPDTSHQLRLVISSTPDRLRCDAGEQEMTYDFTYDPEQPIWLQISAIARDESRVALGSLALNSMTIHGATLAPLTGPTRPLRVSAREPEALRQVAEGPPSLASVLAAAELGRVDPEVLRLLPQAQRARAIRRLPTVLLPAIREALGAGFAEDWLLAWGIPLTYDTPEGRRALMGPSLRELGPPVGAVATIDLARAGALNTSGRAEEALALLEAVAAHAPEHAAEAWQITARMHAAAGRLTEGREALARQKALVVPAEAYEDLILTDPLLVSLLEEAAPEK